MAGYRSDCLVYQAQEKKGEDGKREDQLILN
jgi:hypothetical protein